jgi:hypothetical protein
MTREEKSSKLLEVQRDGGAVVARMFSTTHFGISVFPIMAAFSSLGQVLDQTAGPSVPPTCGSRPRNGGELVTSQDTERFRVVERSNVPPSEESEARCW